ncbi:MAG: 2-C-methyl-D-erythritol 2,4-cyclodiphosphate synthase [Lachnospiraceae bacterium]|nr:2-C-methyl-D-erythritol 2,4-cyclodiphosphate synthase [Lachnospiraceae bacterium]
MRIGNGYDVHKLGEGRKLIIGGVDIPFEKGLIGHSDADVLVHAVMDALLGAMAMGDIGLHFPDTDSRYKDADSVSLLKEVGNMVRREGMLIENIDSVIMCERPKLRPYIDEMRKNMADALDIDVSQVSVKATTEEGLGFTGRGEGIAASAVCLLSAVQDGMSFDPSAAGCPGCPGCPNRIRTEVTESKLNSE